MLKLKLIALLYAQSDWSSNSPAKIYLSQMKVSWNMHQMNGAHQLIDGKAFTFSALRME